VRAVAKAMKVWKWWQKESKQTGSKVEKEARNPSLLWREIPYVTNIEA
jgi:hypothetical protein